MGFRIPMDVDGSLSEGFQSLRTSLRTKLRGTAAEKRMGFDDTIVALTH
jgi:hypothetical protein